MHQARERLPRSRPRSLSQARPTPHRANRASPTWNSNRPARVSQTSVPSRRAGHASRRRRPRSTLVLLPAWLLVGVLLFTGMGLTLNPISTTADDPTQWERGVLLPHGPNLYRLVLCEAQEVRFPLTNGDLVLINPRSLDPGVGQLAILVGSQTLLVTSGQAGATTLSFEAALVDENDRVGGSQTLSIQLLVSQCDAPAPISTPGTSAPAPQASLGSEGTSSELVSTPPTGHLLALGDNHFLLGACRGLRYNYEFDTPALVRQVTSQNKYVAGLTLYNQPSRLMLYTTGPGTTLLSFEADVQEFPDNKVRWNLYTIQVTVNSCTASQSASQTTHEVISLGLGSTSGHPSYPSGPSSSTDGTTGGATGGGSDTVTGTIGGSGSGTGGGGSGASVVGGGSVAVSQALQAGGVTFTGDHDESLGTTHDDGTAFAAHVELNQGDITTAFVRLSNQGQGDIAYVMSMTGISGYTVSATPSGGITQFARTGPYTWKFILPGGISSADTGVSLTMAIPDAAPTGFYSLGSITLRPVNV